MSAAHNSKGTGKHDATHKAAEKHDAHEATHGAHDKFSLHVKQTIPKDAPAVAPPTAMPASAPNIAPKKGLKEKLKGFFFKEEATADAKNVEEKLKAQMGKPAAEMDKGHKDAKAKKPGLDPMSDEAIAKHLREAHKRPRKKLTRQSLQQYLDKAGYEVNAEKVKKVTFQAVTISFLVLTAVILILAATHGAKTGQVIIFILGLWTAVFAGMLLLAYAGLYFFLDYRIYQRTREVEEVLPDFLQLASSNIAAGMPVDRALWYAIRPNFGVLAKEMEEVAKSTMAGEDLETSLLRFTDKYDSLVVKRSINILIEGMHSGGEMADLLNKIALNIEEMKIMKKEMAANVTTYAIFITFASIIIAPFLFALATELLFIIIKITGSLQLDGGSFLTISAPDPEAVKNFQIFSVATLIMSTIFSACIVSVIKRGNVMEGIKTIPVYAAVAVFIYWLAGMLLHGMFSGIV